MEFSALMRLCGYSATGSPHDQGDGSRMPSEDSLIAISDYLAGDCLDALDGLCMDSIWTLYGLYMDSIWPLYGLCMDSCRRPEWGIKDLANWC